MLKISLPSKKSFLILAFVFLSAALLTRSGFYASQYSVVYLKTGDIYFGRFLPFPFHLIFDAWILQRDGNNQVFLAKTETMIWRPQKFIHLNASEIVFYAPLSRQSQVWQTIEVNKSSNEPALIK